jgi:hypothetical protein
VLTINGLPGKQSRGKGEIQRARRDYEYSFRRFIPFWIGSMKPCVRTFFNGMDAYQQGTNKLNGAFHTSLTIMRFVIASAAKAELGSLFLS